MEEEKEKEKYERYLESMRKANKKYRLNNKQYFSEYQKNYYQKNKHNEEYAQKQRDKALKYYYTKKAKKQMELQEQINKMELKLDEIHVQDDVFELNYEI